MRRPDMAIKMRYVEVSRADRMRRFWRIFAAEALKQHRILFGSRLIYFSLLVWPGLQLATTYFTFTPFLGTTTLARRWPLAADPRGIFLFLVTGMLGYIFFWSLVQSAWQFSWERYNGTLEIMFLTPANRLGLVMANGVMALIQSVWLFFAFTVGLILLVGGLHVAHAGMYVVVFIAMVIPAVAWGTLLNSIFIFSRDSGFLYTILDEPMTFFAGVRFPLFALPFWAQGVGIIFPLTTCLVVLRSALLEGAGVRALWPQLLFLLGMSIVLIAVSTWLLARGEAHARRNGSFTLF